MTCISQRLTLQESQSLGKHICPTVGEPGPSLRHEVHIPKSAGSSFALDAQDILRPLHLISQEGCLSLHHGNLLKFLQHFFEIYNKMQKVDAINSFPGF